MEMTIRQWQRLPKSERDFLLRKYSMMFAFGTYQKKNPGCDPDVAFAVAERTWANFKDMALDYFAVSMAMTEQQIESN